MRKVLNKTVLAAALFMCANAFAATLIDNVDVYAVSQGPQMKSAVLIESGKIKAIGEPARTQAGDATRIDGTGMRLYPGLIAANSQIGLIEVEAVRATVDTSEVGSINSNARAVTAIHPDSILFPVARAAGVLSALSVPTTGEGVIAGQSALINTQGWTIEEMSVKPSVAMHIYWPSTRLPPWLPAAMRDGAKKAAVENVASLERAFEQAKLYLDKSKLSAIAPDLRLQALLPVVRGEQPIFVHTEDVAQIRGALSFAQKHKLKMTLVGALDAWRVAEQIKSQNVSVILGSPFNLPMRRSDGYDSIYGAAAKLHAAGVKFAIAGDGGGMSASLEKSLPHYAAHAAAYGLPHDVALRAITLSPAEILGVADRLGSIEVGKDANLVLADGDILEIQTRVRQAFIAGESVDLSSVHTELCNRYQSRYPVKRDACKN